MKATTQAEGRTYYLNWELQKAAEKMLREIMLVKPGETVTITTDYDSNMNLTRAVADAVARAGGHPMTTIIFSTPTAGSRPCTAEPARSPPPQWTST